MPLMHEKVKEIVKATSAKMIMVWKQKIQIYKETKELPR